MKLIKVFLFSLLLLTVLLAKTSTNDWANNSNFSSQRKISFRGEKPQSYQVRIDLIDENYTHTYTLNKGKFQINVKVYGKAQYLNSNNLSQITCQYRATLDSDEQILTGNIDFQAVSTTIGNKDKSKIEEEFKDYIIRKLINEIEQI
jgi:hypothetical protein